MSGGESSDPEGPPLVSGRIIISPARSAQADATVHVYLEEVSWADAPATVVAETAILQVGRPGESGAAEHGAIELDFTLREGPNGPAIDSRSDYAVRVWVDCDGDGLPGPGDLYSDQRYPVLTRGYGRTVTIELSSNRAACGGGTGA